MSIKLRNVHIKNFKSIKDAEFKLEDFTGFVGHNNAGKSNILDAIYWLFRRSSLQVSDFNNKDLEVEITGEITGLSEEVLSNISNSGHRKSIAPYINDEKLIIRRIQKEPGVSATTIRLEVLDTSNESGGVWKSNPTGIDGALSAIFPDPIQIKAMENSLDDIGKQKTNNTIGKLIREILKPVQQSYSSQLEEGMSTIKRLFDIQSEERIDELREFDRKANENLKATFPGVNISLDIPTPKVEDILKNGTLKITEDTLSGEGRDINSMGSGAQRSVQMALIRQLAEVKASSSDRVSNTLLLLDEPELYLHPKAIKHLRESLKELSRSGYQILFTTHSALMVNKKDMVSANLVRKTKSKGTHSLRRFNDAFEQLKIDAEHQMDILFQLGNSSEVLFSDQVILAEGKTEEKVLPAIFDSTPEFKKAFLDTAFVNMHGCSNIVRATKIIKSIGLPVKSIVDLDFAFTSAIKEELISNTDPSIRTCMDIFEEMEQDGDIKLHPDSRLPIKKNKKNPASLAYEYLAEEEDAIPHIQKLHDKLKAKGIWLWTKGAIEVHLGLDSKDRETWNDFIMELDKDGFEASVDEETIELLKWLIARAVDPVLN